MARGYDQVAGNRAPSRASGSYWRDSGNEDALLRRERTLSARTIARAVMARLRREQALGQVVPFSTYTLRRVGEEEASGRVHCKRSSWMSQCLASRRMRRARQPNLAYAPHTPNSFGVCAAYAVFLRVCGADAGFFGA